MKKILYSLIVLCLCACGQKEYKTASIVEAQDITENSGSGFYALGVEMGGSYEEVKRSLKKRVGDFYVSEAIVMKNQKVGPTKFDEIRFYFESFNGVSSLERIELEAYLARKDAQYFMYFWDKEFSDKYERSDLVLINNDGTPCNYFYKAKNSTSVSLESRQQGDGLYYDCKLSYQYWDAINKIYEAVDMVWLENHLDSIAKNKYVFTEY